MVDVCITNLEDSLRQTGLSDDMVDDVMAQYHANKDNLFGLDEDAIGNEINTMLATVRKRAEQKRALKLKETEKTINYANRAKWYIENKIDPEYWLTDIVDGNTTTAAPSGMLGYSNRLSSRTDTITKDFFNRLRMYGDDTPVYEDRFRKALSTYSPEFNRDFIQELGLWQNKLMGEEGHKAFDPDMPEPGVTNNDLAMQSARAIAEVQQEHQRIMRNLGVDIGEIKGYYLPQRWFPDLMEVGTWDKLKAFWGGIEKDGVKLTREAAVLELERQAENKWVDFIKPRLNIPEVERSIRQYRYARNKKEYAKMTSFVSKNSEKAPTVSARLSELLDNPPQSATGFTDGMTALFGDDYNAIRKADGKTRQHASALNVIAESSKFSEEQRSMAKELLANAKLREAIQGMSIPDAGTINIDEFLHSTYRNILRPQEASELYALGATTEQRLMQERFLHFKDAQAFAEVQEVYGYGNSAVHAMTSLRNMAKDQVQLELFAGNPKKVLSDMCKLAFDTLSAERKTLFDSNGDPVRIAQIDKIIKKLPALQKKAQVYANFISGVYNRRSDSAVARMVEGMLGFGRLKLGLSGWAAIGDAPMKGDAAWRNYIQLRKEGIQIDNLLTMQFKTLGYMLHTDKWKYPDGSPVFDEQAHVHAMLGSLSGVMNRVKPFGGAEVSDARAGDFIYRMRQGYKGVENMYMEITGSRYVDEMSKTQYADFLGTTLGNLAAKGIDFNSSVMDMTRSQLQMAGIGEREWNLIAKRGVYKYGRNKENWAISAWKLEQSLTNKDIREYLVERGYKEADITTEDIYMAKRELVDKYDTYIVASANSAVVTPNLETQLAIKAAGGHVDPTSPAGKFFQLFTEFASYPVRVTCDLQRSMRLMLPQLGLKGTFVRGALLVANMYMFGYFTYAVRSMLQGKPAPDPFDYDTFEKAMIAGGGLGYTGELVADILGQETIADASTYLGPTGTTAVHVVDLLTKAAKGEATGKQLADVITSLTPNLWITNLIMDKVFVDTIYKWLAPNYDRNSKIKKWEDKYGTLKDSPLFDQFKKLW